MPRRSIPQTSLRGPPTAAGPGATPQTTPGPPASALAEVTAVNLDAEMSKSLVLEAC